MTEWMGWMNRMEESEVCHGGPAEFLQVALVSGSFAIDIVETAHIIPLSVGLATSCPSLASSSAILAADTASCQI